MQKSDGKPTRAHNYVKLHLLKGHKMYLTVCETRVYRQLSRYSRTDRTWLGQSFDNIDNFERFCHEALKDEYRNEFKVE